MKLSLLTATLLLTGSLYASEAHKLSPTKEGLIAVKLFDTALTLTLGEKLKEENSTMSKMQMCTSAADATMQKMNSELPVHVKMSIASLDASSTLSDTDVEIMKRYQRDIKKKTAGAMMISTAKVGDSTRVYKPLLVDYLWLQCYENPDSVKVGDFKGVIISEVSAH